MQNSGIHLTALADPVIWKIARDTMRDQPGRDSIYVRVDIPVEHSWNISYGRSGRQAVQAARIGGGMARDTGSGPT